MRTSLFPPSSAERWLWRHRLRMPVPAGRPSQPVIPPRALRRDGLSRRIPARRHRGRELRLRLCDRAPSGRTCGGSGGNGGDGGSPSPTPTASLTGGNGSGGNGSGGSTCVAGSSADCAPLASTVVPDCAQACFTSAAPGVGCGATDFACQCQPAAQASLSSLLIPCVATACPAASLPAVIAGASSVCACATSAPDGSCAGSGGSGGNGGSPTPTPTPAPTGGSGSGANSGSLCHGPAVTSSDCGPLASTAIPSCAQACFSSAAPGVGCAVTDFACQCQPRPKPV